MFQDYEADLRCLSAEIGGLISAASRRVEAAQARRRGDAGANTFFGDLENRLREANRVLQQMSLEVRLMPADQRGSHDDRLKEHRVALDQRSRELETLRRRALLSEGEATALQQWAAASGIDPSRDEKARQAKAARERLLQASKELEMSRRSLHECEDIGIATVSDLERNSEVIKHVKGNVRDVSVELTTGSRTARRMLTREAWTSLIFRIGWWSCLVMFAFAAYYYFILRNKRKH